MKFHQTISRNPILNYIREVESLKMICWICLMIICYLQLNYVYHDYTPTGEIDDAYWVMLDIDISSYYVKKIIIFFLKFCLKYFFYFHIKIFIS